MPTYLCRNSSPIYPKQPGGPFHSSFGVTLPHLWNRTIHSSLEGHYSTNLQRHLEKCCCHGTLSCCIQKMEHISMWKNHSWKLEWTKTWYKVQGSQIPWNKHLQRKKSLTFKSKMKTKKTWTILSIPNHSRIENHRRFSAPTTPQRRFLWTIHWYLSCPTTHCSTLPPVLTINLNSMAFSHSALVVGGMKFKGRALMTDSLCTCELDWDTVRLQTHSPVVPSARTLIGSSDGWSRHNAG